MLGSNKDSILTLKKSGIYGISYQSGCDTVYYGKTIRNIETRFTEHMYRFQCMNSDKSGVAKHMIENQHTIDIANIKLIQHKNHIEIIKAL